MRASLVLVSSLILPIAVNASNLTEPKYKCRVEIQEQASIRSLDIPYNLKTKVGELAFEDGRAQKASYNFYGDALTIELFMKSKSGSTEWQSIAQTTASGAVRAAMLKGPPGILVSCNSNR